MTTLAAPRPAHSVPIYRIGQWTVNVGSHRLRRGSEERVLEPKELDVLLQLADAAPAVVRTEDLLKSVWPDTIVVSNAVHQVIRRLRKAFDDDARSPKVIETLPRCGYRLLVPVVEQAQPTWLDAQPHGDISACDGANAVTEPARRQSEESYEPEVSPTVAVLPVQAISENNQLAAFSKIVRQDLIHELSRTPLQIMSSKDRRSADFLIESALRPMGDDVQISFQVIRSTDGHVHWSRNRITSSPGITLDRFRHAAYFAYMTRIVVEMVLGSSESTESDYARDEWIQGVIEFGELAQGTEGDWRAAEAHLLAAMDADPAFVLPIFYMGLLYKNRMGLTLTYADAVEPAHNYARRVLATHPDRTLLLGTINTQIDLDYQAAIANVDHARRHEPGPTLGEIESEIARALLAQGDVAGALVRCETARRLDPAGNRDVVESLMAAAYLATDRFREARRIIDESASLQEAAGAVDVGGHLMRILAYYYTGDLEAAGEAANAAWQAHGDRKPEAFPGVMALLGRGDHTRQLLQDTEERFQEGKLAVASESFWGEFYLGDLDKAFVWLNRAIANREHWLFPMLHHSAILNSVRDDSRFQEAMRFREEIESLGTPTESVAYP